MPDGSFIFEEASKEKLRFFFQINDLRMLAYHRGNGVSKLIFYD
jgi:hypothetical protein